MTDSAERSVPAKALSVVGGPFNGFVAQSVLEGGLSEGGAWPLGAVAESGCELLVDGMRPSGRSWQGRGPSR